MLIKSIYLPIFLKKDNLKATFMTKTFQVILSVLVVCVMTLSTAFSQDYGNDNYDNNYDTSYTEDSSNGSDDSYGDYGSSGSSSDDDKATTALRPKFQRRAYERFTPPLDTISGLITYLSVIEILDQDGVEIYSDSIYKRAQRWLENEFGKKEAKDFTKSSGLNKEGEGYKMVVSGRFPLVVQVNEYNAVPSGEVEFVMELRFKEGRYRYKINNLVHIEPPLAGTKSERRTYFEFYKNQKENVKAGDQILVAADAKINKLITGLYETCKEPIFVDQDDW
jgi:hypothetical protein